MRYEPAISARNAKLPGPGQYLDESVLSQKIVKSNRKNSVGQPFGTAKDRFALHRHSELGPDPHTYSPRTTIEDGAKGNGNVFKSSAKAVIGNCKVDAIAQKQNLKEKASFPGPG